MDPEGRNWTYSPAGPFSCSGDFVTWLRSIASRNRDTAWYSMIDSEWEAASQAFEEWLDPANFDDRGVQRTRLREAMRQIATARG